MYPEIGIPATMRVAFLESSLGSTSRAGGSYGRPSTYRHPP